jgi:hypothetical protein
MKIKQEENKHSISDLYLAAYLKTKGQKFKLSKTNNKYLFQFDKTESLTDLINEYLNENGICEPLAYTNAIKNIKTLIYNNK